MKGGVVAYLKLLAFLCEMACLANHQGLNSVLA